MKSRWIKVLSLVMLGLIPCTQGINPLIKSVYAQSRTNTTIYLPGVEKNLTTGETNKYYSVGGATLQRNTKGGVEKLYYLFPDHLSSTKLIINKDKTEINYLSYYPYGNLSFARSHLAKLTYPVEVTNLYTGQKQDQEINLYYYNARYYNPTIGHFISADSAEGPNRYAYVGNNPVMNSDPSGNAADSGGTGGGINPLSITNPVFSNNYIPGIGASGILGNLPDDYMSREEQIAWAGAFGSLVIGTGAIAGGAAAVSALLPTTIGVSQISTGGLSATAQRITRPANSLIDKIARIPISLRDKANVFDNGAVDLDTGKYVVYMVKRSFKADVVGRISAFRGPLENAQRIMSNVARKGNTGVIRALTPHNAWESAYRGSANCLDCSLIAQKYLAEQGIESVVSNLSRTSSHYGLWVPSEQSLVIYGGRIITGGAERIAKAINRLVSLGGGTGMFQ